MAKKRFIKSHSNFILKKNHQSITNGTILERDYMTISALNGYAPGQVPIYGDSNFKMTVRNGVNGQLKHKYGNWEKRNHNCNDYEDLTIWSLNCLSDNTISNDSKIVINPNYTSLLDFAYFGSAVELIHSSINNIISKFPGELFLSDKQFKYYKTNNDIKSSVLGDDKYIVDNPFNIDIITKSILNSDVDNKLRYFCESYKSYSLYDDTTKVSDIDWIPSTEKNNCLSNGDLIATIDLGVCKLYYYYLNNEKILLHDGKYIGYHIRPNDDEVNYFFNNLDDFESLLLNNKSNPKYKAVLDTPQDTDTGVIIYKKNYIWPVSNGWNLDIESNIYDNYLNGLLSIAEFYDEYYTNNLWRSLTHESIKNLDLTYTKENSDLDNDDYAIGISRLEGIFMAYGRQFDDLKRYIDNIKSINTITYDNKNNIPDYFLSDSLELSGWEVINAMPTQDKTIYTDPLYINENNGYNAVNANNEFMKRLKMNSKYILSSKGTKNSLELLLSLFGLKKYDPDTKVGDYIISEYVAVSRYNTKPDGSEYSLNEFKEKLEELNQLKTNFYYESSESDINTNLLQGLPVKTVLLYDDINETEIEYIIPWFDKLQEIDGSPYFQMKGGWENVKSKKINVNIAPNINEINETSNVKLWGETSKYLNIVRNLNDLISTPLNKLNNGDIYYVYDITDISEKYNEKDTEIIDPSLYSHYFIINNTDNSNLLGYVKDEGNENYKEGWISIKNENIINANSDDGIKILYLESIIDNNLGNNPHTGKGKYDGGKEYLEYFNTLFKYAIEHDMFSDDAYICDNSSEFNLDEYAKTIGFNTEIQKDNMKCWYFTDTQNTKIVNQSKSELPLELIANECNLGDNENYCGYQQIVNNKNDIIEVGANFDRPTYSTDLIPNNFENSIGNTKTYDVASANSIINIKNLQIKFTGDIVNECDLDSNGKCIDGVSFKDFVYNVILPYVEQLIPSTTILEIVFDE